MKAYVAIEYTDTEGKHEIGDEVEFSRETDGEKDSYDTLIRYGIISEKSNGPAVESGAPEKTSPTKPSTK